MILEVHIQNICLISGDVTAEITIYLIKMHITFFVQCISHFKRIMLHMQNFYFISAYVSEITLQNAFILFQSCVYLGQKLT